MIDRSKKLPAFFYENAGGNQPVRDWILALHPDGTRLYLAPVSGGPVLIVSTIAGLVTNTIPLGPGAGPVFGAQPTFTPDGIHLALMSGMNLAVFVNTLADTVESTITLRPPAFEPIRNFTFFFVPANP